MEKKTRRERNRGRKRTTRSETEKVRKRWGERQQAGWMHRHWVLSLPLSPSLPASGSLSRPVSFRPGPRSLHYTHPSEKEGTVSLSFPCIRHCKTPEAGLGTAGSPPVPSALSGCVLANISPSPLSPFLTSLSYFTGLHFWAPSR